MVDVLQCQNHEAKNLCKEKKSLILTVCKNKRNAFVNKYFVLTAYTADLF